MHVGTQAVILGSWDDAVRYTCPCSVPEQCTCKAPCMSVACVAVDDASVEM